MKKLITTPITGNVYWATVDEKKNMITGEKKDVTDDAIECVLGHLMNNQQFKDEGQFGYEWDKSGNRGKVTLIAFDDSYGLVKKDELERLRARVSGDFSEMLNLEKGGE